MTKSDIEKHIPWCRKPFDTPVYIELGGSEMGVIMTENTHAPHHDIWYMIRRINNKVQRVAVAWDCEKQRCFYPEDLARNPIGYEKLEKLFKHINLYLLALAAPSTHKINLVGRSTGISKGKRVVYHAYNNVTINLDKTGRPERSFLTGARGPYRRHEVRGTWAHYHKVAGCTHTFVEREMKIPDPDRPRYICSKCGQLRTWRPSHERGDAGKGWVSKDYTVTHKPPKLAEPVTKIVTDHPEHEDA